MKIAWRFVKEKHIKDAFSGEGARLYGGRWNYSGIPVVYLSEHLSLAVLEQLVHINFDERPIRYAYIHVEIPDNIRIEEIQSDVLPDDWRKEPASNSTKNIGNKWIDTGKSAILRVPSVIIPIEYNLAINPVHQDFKYIKKGQSKSFSIDPRVWGL